jgi:hypothetical protein
LGISRVVLMHPARLRSLVRVFPFNFRLFES